MDKQIHYNTSENENNHQTNTIDDLNNQYNPIENVIQIISVEELYRVNVPKKYINLFNKQTFDPSKNIILIDTSYMIFHKFFALRSWYYRAFPDKNIPNDYDWLEDDIFMNKYRKLFFENLVFLCKKKNVDISNIVFAIDCKHRSIWRNREQTTYKETRKESHKKSNFYSYKIFGIVIDEILPIICDKYGCIVIKHNECEADDVVANCVLNLTQNNNNDSEIEFNLEIDDLANSYNGRFIYIVATDTDYIQICSQNVILMDMKCRELNDRYLNNFTNNINYLMGKILYGDLSDNIPNCFISKDFLNEKGFQNYSRQPYIKCTKNLVYKIMSNIGIYTHFCNVIEEIRKNKELLYQNQNINNVNDNKNVNDNVNDNKIMCSVVRDEQFTKNLIMIDFKMLPDALKKPLDEKIKNQLKL